MVPTNGPEKLQKFSKLYDDAKFSSTVCQLHTELSELF